MKRNVYRVTYDAARDRWVCKRGDGVVAAASPLKAELIPFVRGLVRAHEPSQLVVHGRNGRIQYEHTYPRSSDPRRTRG